MRQSRRGRRAGGAGEQAGPGRGRALVQAVLASGQCKRVPPLGSVEEGLGYFCEEERGEVGEVVAPDHPVVHAGGFDDGDGHVFRLEKGDEVAVGLEQVVFGAAGDPEELEVGGLGVEVREFGAVDGLAAAELRGRRRRRTCRCC